MRFKIREYIDSEDYCLVGWKTVYSEIYSHLYPSEYDVFSSYVLVNKTLSPISSDSVLCHLFM